MGKRPHIIIFNPDQMRADAIGHLGRNPAAVTPNLDAFAETDAVSFGSAFCQNPVCVPSRCSFFTGLYPHVYGHRTMQHLQHTHESNLFSELHNAGYYVWMNPRNDLVAGQEPGLFESQADEIIYCPPTGAPGPVNKNYRGEPGNKNYYSHYTGKLGLDGNGLNYSADDAVVDAAIERIKNPVDDKPLCMFLGLFYPHPPYMVEDPYFSAIDRSKIPPRASEGIDKPLMESELRRLMGMDGYTEDDWTEMRACYLGMCMKVDAQFGKLVAALKEAGIYDDCLIVVLSDHGDYTGDYGISEKSQNTFEDCLTNVPLMVKPPKGTDMKPGVSMSLVELVDFYATVMDFAGVEPDHDQYGKSLRTLLNSHDAKLRDYVFCEGGRMPWELQADEYHSVCGPSGEIPKESLYWPRQTAQTNDEAHCKGTMIRSERYKYIHRSTGADEFYDLEKDPLEEHNVYKTGEYAEKISEMRLAMLDWYQATCDIVPRKADARGSEMQIRNSFSMYSEEIQDEAVKQYRNGMGMVALQVYMRKFIKNVGK